MSHYMRWRIDPIPHHRNLSGISMEYLLQEGNSILEDTLNNLMNQSLNSRRVDLLCTMRIQQKVNTDPNYMWCIQLIRQVRQYLLGISVVFLQDLGNCSQQDTGSVNLIQNQKNTLTNLVYNFQNLTRTKLQQVSYCTKLLHRMTRCQEDIYYMCLEARQ